MVGQAFRGLELLALGLVLRVDHLREGAHDHGTFLRKHVLQLCKLPSTVS